MIYKRPRLLARAGKHEALEYVRTLYGVPKDRCVAAGDSGNDILMLEGEVRPLAVWFDVSQSRFSGLNLSLAMP